MLHNHTTRKYAIHVYLQLFELAHLRHFWNSIKVFRHDGTNIFQIILITLFQRILCLYESLMMVDTLTIYLSFNHTIYQVSLKTSGAYS